MAVQKTASDFSMPGYQLSEPAEAQWWNKTELVHQRAERNRGKVEGHIENCEGTRKRKRTESNEFMESVLETR